MQFEELILMIMIMAASKDLAGDFLSEKKVREGEGCLWLERERGGIED